MPRVIAAILLVAVLAIGGGLIATTAYQAGLSTAVTTASAAGATVVAPVVVPAYGYGWGWHPGFGIFGFLAALFFLFIVFGLIRAIVWRGGPGRHGGWGRGGWSRTRRTRLRPIALGGPRPRDLRRLASPGPRSVAADRPDRVGWPAFRRLTDASPLPAPSDEMSEGASASRMDADEDHPRRR